MNNGFKLSENVLIQQEKKATTRGISTGLTYRDEVLGLNSWEQQKLGLDGNLSD